jgi:hypothetical protein
MKIRLPLFAAATLLLPPLSVLLSGQDWPQSEHIDGAVALPALCGMLFLLAAAYLLDAHSFRRSGSSLLRTQHLYARGLAATGAALGILLACLNFFSPLWVSPLSFAPEMLLAALFGGMLLPAVFIVRLWLSGIPLLLRLLTRRLALPLIQPEPVSSLLLLTALVGLFGGAVWPSQLGWLLWLAPLLLLIALQLLWHESTIFSGAKHGDWSRIALGAASGIALGGGTLAVYTLAGGALYFVAPVWLIAILLAAFGWLCLQLGDVIAEQWRGKKRADVFKKKPFPIPVVVKKD